MKHDSPRAATPRSYVAIRPRPTKAAALLCATVLSLPLLAIALLELAL